MFKYLTKPDNTTIGCDPEVFFINKTGAVHSAIGLIGGNKDFPLVCDGGALQEDNVMGEFNTDPVTNVEDFIFNVNLVYSQLEGIALENGCTIGVFPSKHIHSSLVSMDPKSEEFGCAPDFNAYSMRPNPTPAADTLLRTCAGHIHIGYDVEGGHTLTRSAYLARYLDAYVGTFCVLNDADERRATRYGRAGAFRPKPYGCEYRVPSNFWLKTDELKAQIFNRVRRGYNACKEGRVIPDDTQLAINNRDYGRCKEILKCLEN